MPRLHPTGESASDNRQQLSEGLIDGIRNLVDDGMEPEEVAERVLAIARTFQEGVQSDSARRRKWIQDELKRDRAEVALTRQKRRRTKQ